MGDKILIFLPNTNQSEALKVANKIRINIQNSLYKTDETSISITASIGLAQYNDKDDDLAHLIHRADPSTL